MLKCRQFLITFTLRFLIKSPRPLYPLIGPITFSSAHRDSQQGGGGPFISFYLLPPLVSLLAWMIIPFLVREDHLEHLCLQEKSIGQFLLEFHFKHSPSTAPQSASLFKRLVGLGGVGWSWWPRKINTWQDQHNLSGEESLGKN